MPDLAIVNGSVIRAPGATAVAVTDGRIEAVGGPSLAAGAREVVDARGGTVMPGFDDGHIHLRGGAREATGAQLYPLQTVDAILAAIREHAAAHPERAWVLGRGWLSAPFAEHRRGRVAAGLDADLVVLDRDLLGVGASAIIGTGVALTVLGGRIVHRTEALA